MWGALLSAFGAARAASAAKDAMHNVVSNLIVGGLMFLAIIFISIAIFYGLSPSRGPAAAAFIVALILAAGGLITHYAMSVKSNSDSSDFLSDPAGALNQLASPDNVEYVQREVTRVVRENPVKLSALAVVAAVILARRL